MEEGPNFARGRERRPGPWLAPPGGPVHRAASRPRPLAALCRHTNHPHNTPAHYD